VSGVDVLAVGAHPDDVELACGGYLLTAARRGRRTAVVDLTAGELGTRGDPPTRAREAELAAQAMGLAWRRCLGLPDGGLVDDDHCRRALVAEIRAAQPRLLIGPHGEDPHPDHRAAASLVESAWFLAGLARYAPELGAPHRAARRVTMLARPGSAPDLLVPIDGVWADKLEVLRLHASQMAPGADHRLDGPDPLVDAEALARTFGRLAGYAFAEGFCVRSAWVTDDLLGAGPRDRT
jgi:bacillithiol biosynthesis deacetylase BshB1